MKYKLIPELIKVFKKWNKERNRYSWLWCPLCHHDLNGDNESFIKEDKGFWHYKCARCGSQSKFHLWGPVPIAAYYQKLEKKLSVYKS